MESIFNYYITSKSEKLPEQGWKIHISAYYDNYHNILKKIATYCYSYEIPFKYTQKKHLQMFLGKNANRISSGKLITIYPSTEIEFIKIVRDLYSKLKKEKGPRILTDIRYKDCKVIYYRYGTISRKERVIISPNNEITADANKVGYLKPNFIEDPLEKYQSNEVISSYLLDNYEIEKSIQFSNYGGVYEAVNKNSLEKVIIKEFRYKTGESTTFQSVDLAENETKNLLFLKGKNYVPQLIETIVEEDNFYLIRSYIQGKSLSNLKEELTLAVIPIENKKEIHNRKKKLYSLVDKLFIKFVEMHDLGFYHNDISLNNFLIDDNSNIFFIDTDSSFLSTGNLKYVVSTTYFTDSTLLKEQTGITIDKKRLGYLIIDLTCSANDLLVIDPTGQQTKHLFLKFCYLYNFIELYSFVSELLSWKELQIEEGAHIIKSLRDEINFINNYMNCSSNITTSVKKYKPENINKIFRNIENNLKGDLPKLSESDLNYIQAHLTTFNSEKKYRKSFHLLLEKMYIKVLESEKKLFLNDQNNFSPYVNCTAGLIQVTIKYLDYYYDEKIALFCKELIESIDMTFVRNPSYKYGLSGIADTFLLAYSFYNEDIYLKKAVSKYTIIREFKNVSTNGWLYPDYHLKSDDGNFNTGIEGILYFYKQLYNILEKKVADKNVQLY